MLRMPTEGREKASCGELGLEEGKEKLLCYQGKPFHKTTSALFSPFPPARAYGKVKAA